MHRHIRLKHKLEASGLRAWLRFCRMLGLDNASALGGFLGEHMGCFFKANRIAKHNIALALPHLTHAEQRCILKGMWNNLGRVAAEIAFLPGAKLTSRVQRLGLENVPQGNQQMLFISAHLANWELTYPMAYDVGVPLTLVYRSANNPLADDIINGLRMHHATDMLPKGAKGVMQLLRAIKQKRSIAMLVDQKMNEGLSINFFGHKAMTAPAVAELSLRYNLPIIPVRVTRLKGAHFKTTTYPPIDYTPTGDTKQDVEAILLRINKILESWIRDTPQQWFWVHQRWPNS